jgi:hypothetical protein
MRRNITNSTELTSSESAEYIQSKRKKIKTMETYDSRMNILKRWMINKHPEHIDTNNNLMIPLPTSVVMEYFGDLVMEASALDLADQLGTLSDQDHKPKSVSHIVGFRSALIDLYRSKGLEAMEAWKELEIELKKGIDFDISDWLTI